MKKRDKKSIIIRLTEKDIEQSWLLENDTPEKLYYQFKKMLRKIGSL